MRSRFESIAIGHAFLVQQAPPALRVKISRWPRPGYCHH
jgi:hypothetical protein